MMLNTCAGEAVKGCCLGACVAIIVTKCSFNP